MRRIYFTITLLCLFCLSLVFYCLELRNEIYYMNISLKETKDLLDYIKEKASPKTYYFENVFKIKKMKPASIIFVGNSLTNGNNWQKAFPGKSILNCGIGGENSKGLFLRINDIVNLNPKKIFIEIGIGDILKRGHGIELSKDHNIDSLIFYYKQIIVSMQKTKCQIFIQSILPVDTTLWIGSNKNIVLANYKIKELSDNYKCIYIDLYPKFTDIKHLTKDGVHLNRTGYNIWEKEIRKYVN
jgi:lysophospholipase L1-like esterase